MIYEYRVYRVIPGRMPALLQRFEKHTSRIFKRLGFRQVGYWQNYVGPSQNELIYMLAWQSLEEHERSWDVFIKDPEWIEVEAESEKDGPIVQDISNSFLMPTSFSKLK